MESLGFGEGDVLDLAGAVFQATAGGGFVVAFALRARADIDFRVRTRQRKREPERQQQNGKGSHIW